MHGMQGYLHQRTFHGIYRMTLYHRCHVFTMLAITLFTSYCVCPWCEKKNVHTHTSALLLKKKKMKKMR